MKSKKQEPFISPHKTLPEITLRALILGAILTILLCASNAYLGLKVGNTVSASIPAAIIAMVVLRWFKNANVLENNIVQTMASVGEALVAGVAYVAPALLILHVWHQFDYGKIFVLAILGGFMGVLTTIIVRRVMMDHEDLRFPEGTAIAEVLKASADSQTDVKPLVMGGLVGGAITLFQSGFQFLADQWQFWIARGHSLFGFGVGFSPAIFAAGYIIGPVAGVAIFIGVLIGWFFGVPILGYVMGVPHASSNIGMAVQIWTHYVRYIGVGTMLVGGLWTLCSLALPIVKGVKASLFSVSQELDENGRVLRTEQDIRFKALLGVTAFVLLLGFFSFFVLFHLYVHHITPFVALAMCLLSIVLIMVLSFVFASLAAYFAGLVGATNCPGSGFVLASVIIFSLFAALFMHFFCPGVLASQGAKLAAFVILANVMVCCSIAIANDSSQDLKSGQIIGATPWRQELVLFVGVIIAALVITPILNLLFNAYGIGGVFPHPGMPHDQMLSAPQAAIMAAVVKGVFNHNLPWDFIITGGVIAVIGIIVNGFIKRYDFNIPVLAVGLGIYLPIDSSMPAVIGGLLAYFATRKLKQQVGKKRFYEDHQVRQRLHKLLLLACGMVAGASLMGVVLAIPFAIKQSSDALKLVNASFTPYAVVLSFVVTIALCVWFYRSLVFKNGEQ